MGFHGLDITARLRRKIMTKKVVTKIVTYASRYLTECPLSREVLVFGYHRKRISLLEPRQAFIAKEFSPYINPLPVASIS